MNKVNKALLTILLSALPLVIMAIGFGILHIQYEREVGGYLKQAADANTTELAEQKLKQAIDGMDKRGICPGEAKEGKLTFSKECFTSVLWRTPDEDVGYWRENIQATYDDLHGMTPEERADNLIESNQLMKVRETLLDNSGQHGVSVTAPQGISKYPNNKFLAFFMTGSVLLLFGTLGFFWYDSHQNGY